MTALDNLKRLAEARLQGRDAELSTDDANDLDALIAEFEERERKVERLIAAIANARAKDGRAQVSGEIAQAQAAWREVDEAVADLQADSPPPIARDPIPDTGGKIKW